MPLSLSLNIYLFSSFYFPISSHGRHSVTICGLASWSAQSHYLAKLASSQVWGFFFFFFSCVRGWVCVSTDAAVCYLRQYNVHSWMLEQWAAISDCTNTAAHRIPQDIWVSSVLPLSLFPFRLATIQTSLVSSQRKSVGWKPGQLSQTALSQDLAGVDGVLESY